MCNWHTRDSNIQKTQPNCTYDNIADVFNKDQFKEARQTIKKAETRWTATLNWSVAKYF